MKRNNRGFTLVELVVVGVIVGILAAVGIPRYLKTVETSKATNAAAITHMIASANRTYHIDNPSLPYAAGVLSNDHILVTSNYIIPRDWRVPPAPNAPPYTYSAGASAGAACGGVGTILACSLRNSGPHAGVWGYTFNDAGTCHSLSDTPACPVF